MKIGYEELIWTSLKKERERERPLPEIRVVCFHTTQVQNSDVVLKQPWGRSVIKYAVLGRKSILVKCPWEWGHRNYSHNSRQASEAFLLPHLQLAPSSFFIVGFSLKSPQCFLNIPTAFPNHPWEYYDFSFMDTNKTTPGRSRVRSAEPHRHQSTRHVWNKYRGVGTRGPGET